MDVAPIISIVSLTILDSEHGSRDGHLFPWWVCKRTMDLEVDQGEVLVFSFGSESFEGWRQVTD